MEESSRILEELLQHYEIHFDMERPFRAGQTLYDAYGQLRMLNTKYVLVKEAQMWRAYFFEHVFFQIVDTFTASTLNNYREQLLGGLEPEFVRKGEKYPMPDHMCTALSHVFISRGPVAADVAKMIRRHKFRKYYRFAFRGYCEGRLAVIDLENRRIQGNAAAGRMVKSYRRRFRREGIK